MNYKPRVLWCGEASFLSTGYATYQWEVLNRLHKTGKFELMELSAYGPHGDQRRGNIPWLYESAMANPNDQAEVNAYNSDPLNQFGAWKFEEVCIKFKPDFVCSIRDPWMDEMIYRSPLRNRFKHIYMPTVDAEPQQEQWIDQFIHSDVVLTYTDWAAELLKKQGGGKINLGGTAPAGVDFNVFKPVANKIAHKKQMGIADETFIVGMVARNQARKLYPDLMEAFVEFLDKATPEEAQKSFLYLHTSWPDVGWDIPRLIKENGLSGKVVMTYACMDCGAVYPNFFADSRTVCRMCSGHNVTFPNSKYGVSREILANIYNLFDVYVQYANCFPAKTEVLTNFGWKPIEYIKVGHEVLTHTGAWQEVKNTFKNDYSGEMVTFRCWGEETEVTSTPEHPFYVIHKGQFSNCRSLKEKITRILDSGKELPEPEFLNAENITKGDFIAFKIDDEIKDFTSVDTAEYLDEKDYVLDQHVMVKGGKLYPRYWNIDEEFLLFLGLYAADGSANMTQSGQIVVTSHSDELEHHQLSLSVMNKLSPDSARKYEYKDRASIAVGCSGKPLARIFSSWCGSGEQKGLPDWACKLPDHRLKKVLQGMFWGDGHYSEGRKVSSYSTISERLATQLKHILRRLKLRYAVSTAKNTADGKNRIRQYKFEVIGNVKKLNFNTGKRRKSLGFYYNGYHFLQVRTIKRDQCSIPVFNLEVELDNSFTTRIGCAHNCEGQGIPQVEAAGCGVPVFSVDYSGMSDVVRKVNGRPIRVQRFYRESETHCRRALPDNSHLVSLLLEHIRLPSPLKTRASINAREGAIQHYDWDKTARVWERHLCNLPADPDSWRNLQKVHAPNLNVPKNLSNEQFVRWGLVNISNRPELLDSYLALRMTRDLNWQARLPYTGGVYFNEEATLGQKPRYIPYHREDAIKDLENLCHQKNYWEGRLRENLKG